MRFLVIRTTLLIICAMAAASGVFGQSSRPPVEARTKSPSQVEETFELNIIERHITQQNFAASTAVEIPQADSKNVRLQIGVALRAERIDVTLRGVRGSVRFRASLQSVLDRIKSHAQAGPQR